MKSIAWLLYPFVLLAAIACNGQNTASPASKESSSSAKKEISKGYEIDPSIRGKLKNLSPDSYMGGVMDASTTSNGEKIPILSAESQGCMTYYIVKGDSIIITLMPAFTPGYAVGILIKNDSATVFRVESPKGPIYRYKYNRSDSSYLSHISVKGISSKVVLAAVPKVGEPIEGIFEFESDKYYQKNEPQDAERVYKAKGIFVAKQMK